MTATPQQAPGPILSDDIDGIRFRFFKNLSTAERLNVFRVFLGWPESTLAQVRTHSDEARLLKAMFKGLAAVPGKGEPALDYGLLKLTCEQLKNRLDAADAHIERLEAVALQAQGEPVAWMNPSGMACHCKDVFLASGWNESELRPLVYADATPTIGSAPQANELIELLSAIRPSHGDVGSRDVDVSAQQKRIDRAIQLLSTGTPQAERAAVPMILHCPKCHEQHVDAPDERTAGWANPPHRSHLCHGCGYIWRPADVPTNGVAAIKTTGKADSPQA
jgi:DNA-directed RNA polymerase subunit M/transcription elongation factor TFIIS